jgi:hypothetical protein
VSCYGPKGAVSVWAEDMARDTPGFTPRGHSKPRRYGRLKLERFLRQGQGWNEMD